MRLGFVVLPLLLAACATTESAAPLQPLPPPTAPEVPPPPAKIDVAAPRAATPASTPPAVDPLCAVNRGPINDLLVVGEIAETSLLQPAGVTRAPYEEWLRKNASARAEAARVAAVTGTPDQKNIIQIMASAADGIAKNVQGGSPYDMSTQTFVESETKRVALCGNPPGSFGRLAPETIQIVVRAHFGWFRKCYETALGRDPKAAGRVAFKFVIARDGTVNDLSDPGSELHEPQMRACMESEFKKLRFAPPERGIVTVVYPLVFSPQD